MTFDFEAWLAEAHEGLAILKGKRSELIELKAKTQSKLDSTEAEITTLEAMLVTHGGLSPQEDEKNIRRTRGVAKTAKEIAQTLPVDIEWKEEQLVGMVMEKFHPDVPREKSVRQALRKLGTEGVFTARKDGKQWLFKSIIGVQAVPKDLDADADDTPPADDAPPPEAPASEEDIVAATNTAIEAISDEMKKRRQLGIGDSHVKRIAEALNVPRKAVREALRQMVQGPYEMEYEGELKVLRHKKKTEREALKQTRLTDQPLFPSADRPEHA